MAQLFKKIPAEKRKSVRYEVRLSPKEAETIHTSAHIRNLSVAEFIRRAALKRRADIRYETEIVLTLREVVQSIRRLHAALVERGIQPPEDEWRPLIKEAVAAMLRISK